MWRLCKLGYRYEPRLMVVAFALSLLAALPDALLALWLKLLADGRARHRTRRLVLRRGRRAGRVGAPPPGSCARCRTRVQRRFRDKVTIALESHVARLQASVATVAHHERPDYLDRLSVLRDQVFVLDHMYMSVFSTVGWILRLAVTVVLLMSISPCLVLLALFAVPTVLTSSWRPAVERAAQERGAPSIRLARHLFVTATTAPPGKEVRVTGIADRLVTQRRAAWERWYAPMAAGPRRLGLVARGRVGRLRRSPTSAPSCSSPSGLSASPGDVLLVLAAGAQLSAYIGATVGEIGFLRGIWMDGSRRLAWLEDYAASFVARADAPVPDALHDGIELRRRVVRLPGRQPDTRAAGRER